MLLKNELHTVTIEDYSSEGFGVCRVDGQVVFVTQALVGETCIIRILKTAKTHAWAKVEEILTASDSRQTPACPVFGPCGGCDLLHMSYEEELALKEKRVQSAFSRLGGVDAPISPIISANARIHYRNKAIFAVSAKGLGFYRRRSHDVVPVENCLIQSPIANRVAAAVYSWMQASNISAYDELSHSGILRHLFVRTTKAGAANVCLVVKSANVPQKEALIDSLREQCPEITGILLCINPEKTNVVLRGRFELLWGEHTLEETLCGLTFRLSPQSFFQVSPTQAEILYETALSYAALNGTETVLDLYCGTGTITQILAQKAKLAIGGEIVASAVADACENAKRNGITNVEFIEGDAAKVAATLKQRSIHADVVVVDPPRKGLDESVISEIANIAPERVVYVSCDPATLARDVGRLTEKGYTLKKVQPVDMFPCTTHVETVALLTRCENS